jgi:hypothetical protein
MLTSAYNLIIPLFDTFSDLDLALENWVDTFQFLSRGKLAALLPHIGDEQEEVM